MKKTIIATALATIIAIPAASAAELYNKDGNTVGVNGKIAVAAVKKSNADTNFEDNGSRIGFTFGHEMQNGWSASGEFQWGVNGTGDNSGIAISSSGISTIHDDTKLFNNRLANVTLANKTYGSLTFGKQWSAYYNVVANTDNANIWGAAASGAYAGNGVTGTGRVDNAIQYNQTLGDLSFAVQMQLQNDTATSGDVTVKYGNTYGGSVAYNLNNDVTLAAGANFGKYKGTYAAPGEPIERLHETDSIYAIGATYGSLSNDGLYIAGNYNHSNYHQEFNGDLLPSANGYEFNVAYTMDKIQPYVIYNMLTASNFINFKDQDVTTYRKQEFLAGINYNFDANVTVFIEGKKDYSKFVVGNSETNGDNAIGVGLTYNF